VSVPESAPEIAFRDAKTGEFVPMRAKVVRSPRWELPEGVRLAEELGAVLRLRNLPVSNGYMSPAGKGKIVLNRRLFTTGDSAAIARTFFHEFGHLIDFVGGAKLQAHYTIKRGNVLGRLAVLRDFMHTTFPFIPPEITPLTLTRKAAKAGITTAERNAVRNVVYKAWKNRNKHPGVTKASMPALKKWLDGRSRAYQKNAWHFGTFFRLRRECAMRTLQSFIGRCSDALPVPHARYED
jgi:hypothetical protein